MDSPNDSPDKKLRRAASQLAESGPERGTQPGIEPGTELGANLETEHDNRATSGDPSVPNGQNNGNHCDSAHLKTIIGALWAGNLFSPLLAASVIATLPAMGRDLQATAVQLSLVLSIYALSQVVFNILGGRFGDLWGRRRILLTGIGLLCLLSVGMGFAPNIEFFLGMRFFQGMAAAMISSCVTAIAISMSPVPKRGQIMGTLASAVYLGLTLGPLIGGGVATLFGWRWQFFGIVLPGVLVLALLRHFIKQEWREARGETFDLPGACLLLLGLGLITLGASGPGINRILLWLLPFGVLVMAAFFRRQWRIQYPILDIRMFAQAKGMGAGLVAMFINYGSTMGLIFFFSLYLQQVRGLTPFHAGLFMVLQSVVQMIFSPVGGRLGDKLGAELISATGMVICGVAIFGLTFLGLETPLILLIGCQILLGVGIGFFSPSNMVSTLRNVQARHLAVASGLMGSMRTMGALFSQVLTSIIVGHYLGSSAVGPDNMDSFLKAMHIAMLCFSAINLCGVFVGLGRIIKK